MKPTIESILLNQLNRIHAEVIMTAYSESIPNWSEHNEEPDFYRFIYTSRGQGWLELHNERYAILPGTLYLLPAHTVQSFGTEGDELFGRYWCHFRLEAGDIPFMSSLMLPTYVPVQDDQTIKQLFDKMIASQHYPPLTKGLRLKSALLEMLSYFIEGSHIEQEDSTDASIGVKWNEVIEYIELNLHTNIQVVDLAKFAFLHPNYFISSFKSKMGCSPIQYVTNRRIAKAKYLLANTLEPISSVARTVGMQNHYLSRLFKRHTGITPIQYRRIAKLSVNQMIKQTMTENKEEKASDTAGG